MAPALTAGEWNMVYLYATVVTAWRGISAAAPRGWWSTGAAAESYSFTPACGRTPQAEAAGPRPPPAWRNQPDAPYVSLSVPGSYGRHQ
ncbi:hypothetical protein SSCG_05230 [Streptomyces clavuligerus]|nr:hypothetical protein SSCG_05230 [Streptomyces clavuligerus]